MQNRTIKAVRNNVILSVILVILFIATGIMPYFLGLASVALTGNTVALISYGFVALGVLIGFFVGLFGLLIGLFPILIPVGIAYWIFKRNIQI